MKKVLLNILVFFVLIFGVILYWTVSYPSYSLRYKITVEIETPEGIRSGSAVREVFARIPVIRFYDGGRSPGIRGEAAVINLGERGLLFSLISWDSFYEVTDTFSFDGDEFGPDGIRYYRSLKAGLKAPLLEKNSSTRFVTLKDINDPISMKSIDKQKMEEVFGKGVKLKQITVEITDEPVTSGVIEKYLGKRRGIADYEFVRG